MLIAEHLNKLGKIGKGIAWMTNAAALSRAIQPKSERKAGAFSALVYITVVTLGFF